MKKITLILLIIQSLFSFGQFTEGFESGIPADWTIINGGDANTWVSNITINIAGVTAHTGTKVARIDYSDVAHNDLLVTKPFLVTSNVTNRLSVWARQLIYQNSTNETFDILVSTTGNSAADFTTSIASAVSPTAGWTNYTYSLNAFVGQTIYIAFKSTTTEQYQLYLDDISIDAIPLALPTCVQNQTATINETCGNLFTTLNWNFGADATGYNLTVGTSAGGTDVINNQNIGYVNTYKVPNQVAGTNYFWKLSPYNLTGTTTNCPENFYTTFFAPCYCTPNPQAVDGLGITNFTMGTINNTSQIEAGNYADFSVLTTSAIRGTSIPFSIKMETAYAYNMVIWVDWNDDFDFDDAGETAFTGTSTEVVPNFVTGSLSIPSNAQLGKHTIRVSGQFYLPIDPCYSGLFAAFEDYSIMVTPNLSSSIFDTNTISVSPNPVQSILNLKANSEMSVLTLFTIVGQKVDFNLLNPTQLDLSNLKAGTYILKIQSENGSKEFKIIKQ